MTNSIGSLQAGQSGGEAAAPNAASGNAASGNVTSGVAPGKSAEPVSAPDPAAAVSGAGSGGAQASEAVTLSADAQATAGLLDAARAADGIDTAKVAQLRQAVQAGSYDAKPEDVAKAITSAFGGAVNGSVTGRSA